MLKSKSALKPVSLALWLLAVSQSAHALEFECVKGDDTRFIRQELPGITHLCEVTVTKSDEEREVMWYANHDTMFCTDKSMELKAKYTGKWGFSCTQWPDHDGLDQLSKRQRSILDAELKALVAEGKAQTTPFMVEGLKAAANSAPVRGVRTLVVQFFLFEPDTTQSRDVTHVIQDDGVSWTTISKIETLTDFIESDDSYTVNSALVSSVTDAGAMEVITVIDTVDPASNTTDNCYGNQTLATQGKTKLVPRTPHRYVCTENTADNGAG